MTGWGKEGMFVMRGGNLSDVMMKEEPNKVIHEDRKNPSYKGHDDDKKGRDLTRSYEHAHEKTSLMAFFLQWYYLLAEFREKGRQFYNVLKMEYSFLHVVFLYNEALFYLLGHFQLSDTKFCAYLKTCDFSIREVFPWARSYVKRPPENS